MDGIMNEKITGQENNKQTENDEKLKEKREYYKEHQRRFQKRRKLKGAAPEGIEISLVGHIVGVVDSIDIVRV